MVHLLFGQAEHSRRRGRVDVRAGGERLGQALVPGQMGQDAQLDLRVVGHQEDLPVAAGHEGPADLPSQLPAYRDVLEVGVGGGEAPGGRHGLVEGGVDPSGGGVYQLGQRHQVGGAQLVQLAPGKQRVHDGVRVP